MSLESAMDEERREVMNLLEGRPANFGSSTRGAPEPIRTASPAAPVRSMLDIGPALPRHGSIAGISTGITSPLRSAPLTGSMLDSHNSIGPSRSSHSTGPSSPADGLPKGEGLHRTQSDASSHAPARPRSGSGNFPYSKSQFDMSTTVSGQALPKRVTQGGKKGLSSMASIMQGQELEPILKGRDGGRHNSTAGILGPKHSRSPSSRLSRRSESPGTAMLNNNSFNPMPTPGKFLSDTGKVIDLNNAYRKLSDANFLKSGSSLSAIAPKDAADRARVNSGEALSPSGELRLRKDYYEDGEDAIESSDEPGTSDEEAWGSRPRGRSRRKKDGDESIGDDSNNESLKSPKLLGNQTPRFASSLLAAAEEERVNISSKYSVKSLLEPEVMVTSPSGERLYSKKAGVHPNTNYNAQISQGGSPATSDSEDLGDIRRAQRLAITMSPIDNSIPNRVIRAIIRGEFSKMQQEAEEGSRRVRTYLVATDLSSEAAYALEWTIGTVLRDGDTIMALYAVDEEVGTSRTGDADSVHSLGIGDGGTAIQEAAVTIGRLTEVSKNAAPTTHVPSPLSGLGIDVKSSRPSSTDSRSANKAELERIHAIEDISQTCIKFLRKTKLQVRVAVEVMHCKSPKYMITEAIDMLEPTLVILGSRGRSALKGILLGSFSNYLVTKSSVPVMVARKKLQKPNSKNKLPHVRLANNLMHNRRLSEAKID